MTTSHFMKLTILASSLTLIGCATNQGSIAYQTQPERGAAFKAALAKQIVDPNPTPGAPTPPTGKAVAAVTRYLNDEVKKPVETQEISINSGE